MPQLVLEFSSNVIEKHDLMSLFEQCHLALVETLPTNLSSCKSRAVERTIYCIGDNDSNNAFVHISLKVMSGRQPETLLMLGQRLIAILEEYFSESIKQLKLQISLEIDELAMTYFKI